MGGSGFRLHQREEEATGKALGKVGTGAPRTQRAHSMLEEDLGQPVALVIVALKSQDLGVRS